MTPDVGRREATKAANRAAILEAARDVFAELGYGTTTVRDVIARTDLASGTFYNYFPDKDALFRAVLEESASRVRVLTRAARKDARTPEDFVARGYEAFFTFLASEPELMLFLRRNSGTIRVMDDEPFFGIAVTELEADLKAGIEAGVIPDLDVQYMAGAMVGAGLEVGTAMADRDPPDVEGATRFATALFLGGIERLRAP